MKKHFFLALILLTTNFIMAQTKVHKGTSIYNGDAICNKSNDKLYKKISSSCGDLICNISGSKIYKSNSSYLGDVFFNIQDEKVYKETIIFELNDKKHWLNPTSRNSQYY